MAPTAPARRPSSSDRLGRSLSICVFCGARQGRRPAITHAARELGSLIGSRGHDLVYGAGGSGLMGEMAWAAWRRGAKVTGYAPRFIHEREQGIAAPEQTLHISEDMFERKRRMIEHGDAFIVLPGGYGTLDEVLEVISLNSLNVEDKPLILLNTEGFWDGLVRFTEALHAAQFADQGAGSLFHIAQTPEEAVGMVELALPAETCRATTGATT